MNILIYCQSHSTFKANYCALVPSDLLQGYNLNAIDGHTDASLDSKIGDQIAMIFDRLGLIPFTTLEKREQWLLEKRNKKGFIKFEYPPFITEQDLKQYLNPLPPFTVDKMITIA